MTTHAPASETHRALPWWVWLLLPLTALHIVEPMWNHGFSCGHDLTFHLTNWFEAARQWRQGVVYPRWATDPNFTAGEPRFIFYPPASWMLGGAIASVFGLFAAPYIYIFVVLCAAGTAMYRLARLVLWPAAAMAAAMLYMANPYMVFVIYTRSAYSEMLAAAILPLLFLAVLRPRIHIALVAEVVAALWLTSAPGAVIGMYSLALLAVLSAWRHRSVPNLWRAAAGTALGMGVAAIYIVPAAYERKWVQIARIRDAAYNFHQSFLFGHSADALHDAVLRQASWIAVMTCGVIAIATLILIAYRSRRHMLQNRVFFLLAIFSGVASLLLLPITAFAWQHLPELAYLQFPWRWLLALAPVSALLLAAVFGLSAQRRVPLGLGLLVSVLTLGAASHIYSQQCDSQDAPRSVLTALRSGAGQEGTDEYTPLGADTSDLQQASPRVWLYSASEAAEARPSAHHATPERPTIAEWSPKRKLFSVDLEQPTTAILQVMDYPAWQMHRNGQPQRKSAPASSGQIQIALPAGHSEIDLRFVHTVDRILADAVSAVSLLLLLFAAWRERHHHVHAHVHPPQPNPTQ